MAIHKHGHAYNPAGICRDGNGWNRYQATNGPLLGVIGVHFGVGGSWYTSYLYYTPGDYADVWGSSERVVDSSNDGYMNHDMTAKWPDGVIAGRSANVNFAWLLFYNPGSGCTPESWETSTPVGT
ncbi:MAG TPA: hypothetical protein VFM93_12345 [Candidatus Limnocylindria bacterium]|nr:hypothetical protein [Candidatus Limnocylindria bacterium]